MEQVDQSLPHYFEKNRRRNHYSLLISILEAAAVPDCAEVHN